MRPTRYVTAIALLAAFVIVGCSKRGDSAPAKAASPDSVKPATRVERPGAQQSDGEGAVATTSPAITGTTSFADGQAAYQAKKYGEATAIFDAYTQRQPGNAWGFYMLGLSAWKAGDFSKSEEAFEKVLSIDPRHMKSYMNSSRVLIDQNKLDAAAERLTHAAGIDPELAEVQRLLGRVFRAQGKTDEAIAAYRRAIDLNDLDAWSMNNLGLVLLDTGRADEALPLFTQAVALKSRVPEFHNNLGMALEHTGRFKAAAGAYADALTADPRYEKARQNLARVEAVKVDFEKPLDGDGAKKVAGEESGLPGEDKSASK